MPTIDVVIPTYNNLDELKNCLKSFLYQTVYDFSVWVCVDGSTDGTIEFLDTQKKYNFINILQHADGKNHGRAATRNLALPFLSAKYVVFLDSDFEVKSDFLENHLKVFLGHNLISVGQIYYSKSNIWRDYTLSRGKHKYEDHLAELPYQYFESGNVALPTEIFTSVNGFDESFKKYGGEDTELACRLWKKFYLKTYLNLEASAFGKMEKSVEVALLEREEFAKTGLKYIRQKHPDLNDIFKLPFFNTFLAKLLYHLTNEKLFLKIIENSLLPNKLRLKLLHLLVFCSMYRGYHY